MSEFSKSVFGEVGATPMGVRMVRPSVQSLQVSELGDGRVVITFAETGRDAVLFTLSAQQRRDFAALVAGEPARREEA